MQRAGLESLAQLLPVGIFAQIVHGAEVMWVKQRYSTGDVAAGLQLSKWQEYMSTVYYDLDIVPAETDRIWGELTEAQFGELGISNFKSNAQKVVRDRAAALRDRSENFVFLFPTRRSLAFEQKGRSGCARPGTVALINSAEGYAVTVPDGSENITLKIPCDRLRARLPGLDDACGLVGIANPHLVPVVSHLGEQLLKLDNSANVAELQKTLVDLVCLMMSTDSSAELDLRERRTLAAATFDRIVACVRDGFANPRLTPATIAARLRISNRYLHRVCQLHDQTVGQVVMDARLAEASRLLQASRRQGQSVSISEIAYRCGFVSQSHFTTRFRERFGVSPRAFQ